MCGIAGYAVNAGRRFSENMIKDIYSRGPDSSGCYRGNCLGKEVGLFHSRLSIIDLSDFGAQPMYEAVTDWRLVFNGEVYNYLELRRILIDIGWNFVGHSDTEVLLKAWSQWGLNALDRLNGMFAFAAYNSKKKEIWLIRDRYGIKPLLWAVTTDRDYIFSSSAASLAKITCSPVDVEYCARGLQYKTFELFDSGSAFSSVKAVPPGGWIRLDLSADSVQITDGLWYDLSDAVEAKRERLYGMTSDELEAECRFLLHDSVKLRLRSDVPIAVSLSGGIDSSTVASNAALAVDDLKGFTYGAPDVLKSEGPLVAELCRNTGIEAEYVWPQHTKSSLGDLIDWVLSVQEAPFSGLSILAQNEVYKAVNRAGYKVLLGGQGGDEGFAGYRKFFVVAVREAIKSGNALEIGHFVASLGIMLLYEARQVRTYWQNLGRYNDANSHQFRALDWSAPAINLWGRPGAGLAGRQIEDVKNWSLPTLLRYEDRNSMGYGIESRLPFMDYRLMELALALPARMKIAKGYGKWIIRRLGKGHIPDAILFNRKKRGFDVTQNWIQMGLGEILRERIGDNLSALSSYTIPNLDVSKTFDDERLSNDSNLLSEALMLAWLVDPYRAPIERDMLKTCA